MIRLLTYLRPRRRHNRDQERSQFKPRPTTVHCLERGHIDLLSLRAACRAAAKAHVLAIDDREPQRFLGPRRAVTSCYATH